jgi:hypothetical protein
MVASYAQNRRNLGPVPLPAITIHPLARSGITPTV